MGIYSIKIQNFKSIRETDDMLIKPLNVLIGPNGAGKSNFISFFKFLNRLYEQQLQLYISQNGRAENFLFFGSKGSDFLAGRIVFDNNWKNEYVFKMVPDQSGNLIFAEEWSNFTSPGSASKNFSNISIGGNPESVLKNDDGYRNKYLRTQFNEFKLFHFHDTSFNSKVKQPSGTQDYASLREDGGNLAAFLYRLQESHPKHFKVITRIIQSIAPFFQDFYLVPDEINTQHIFLRWKEKGSDQLFTAHNLSDGTLRMICLTTLLMQPHLPGTIIIDEPELGLHPFAIQKLAAMLKSASDKSQIIVSTQSVNLVDQFTADDIIVVERSDNQTVFKRQSEETLAEWIEEYSLGELWSKNVLGGTP
ncbi:MAG TPA: AAA family ATPase [Bacteroidales bacterium]|jgi:predicted ATPase|nr:AAA family ATPase [Bacteroidales bacterium]HQH23780.1 AAA family ATPase [Bacteroidales bacterium]HQJ81605.1 AAA family ATPase [Bacteroidales bacterium]